ncbi:hypothetical protein [Streptacidiphilus fuscans]|uniref:Secreted protein n=1 Tax=Streptacidiphilus fuscans TaxID=2789292 RepID=A0A931B9Q0_9ACTN|nr:hypothetical protein [Streptacidiphilus fuscans]MBF9072641.1 hypothetical protein [Streptacidiphilus fuscans]
MKARRNARRLALRAGVGAAFLVSTFLLLSPQQASACDVSIGYKPSMNISDLDHPSSTCSTSTSLVGAGVVDALGLGALVAIGWGAYRRSEKSPDATSTKLAEPAPALVDYLRAAGIK